jgi:hypothetical protein
MKIRSQNELFRGQMVNKPKPAIVVGQHPEEGPIYCCPHCGAHATADECDVMGAEPDCVFCPNCNGEFEL